MSRRRPEPRECRICGDVWIASSAHKSYCSAKCSKAAKAQSGKKWCQEHSEYYATYNKRWQKEHPKQAAARIKRWRSNHPEKAKAIDQRPAYKARRKVTTRLWQQRTRSHRRAHERHRRLADPLFLIKERLKARVRRALRRLAKDRRGHFRDLVGCSPADLAAHIERQFMYGMSWKNRDKWHIDHVRPVSSFDLTDPSQQRACFHYSNLRPLWKKLNLKKGASWSGQEQFSWVSG